MSVIPASLEALRVPIEGLHHYQKNARTGDVDAIARSLEVNGQYRPVVVNSRTSEVLAGNHTLKAARLLGWTEIAATFVDADDQQAARIVLVDNRTNDLAEYDDHLLADLLEEIGLGAEELEGSGYDLDAVEEILARITAAPVDFGDAFGAVPDGDRADATQMTFTLTLDQAELVRGAVTAARTDGGADRANKNENGNALARICREWADANS